MNEEDYCKHCGQELDWEWYKQIADDDGIEYKFCTSCDWSELEDGWL
jgi:hypothetical protein